MARRTVGVAGSLVEVLGLLVDGVEGARFQHGRGTRRKGPSATAEDAG
jgi:hypothetical protein